VGEIVSVSENEIKALVDRLGGQIRERKGKYGVLDKETMKTLIKEAHALCKTKVKFSRHEIGGTAGGLKRRSLRRDRASYLGCIREVITKVIDAMLPK
jgi:hypothetical protein